MIRSPGRLLAQLGHTYGHDVLLVQAAGGNLSLKTSAKRMAIKASGVRLKEMTATQGWAMADHHAIAKRLSQIAKLPAARARELAYVRLLEKASRTPGRRVSMETGFHAIFKEAYVLHLHSLAGVLLGMMPEKAARALVSRVLGDTVRVFFAPATLPGFELTNRMRVALARANVEGVQLWIQRNHGVVWVGQDRHVLRALIRRFESRLRSLFDTRRYPAPHTLGSRGCRSRRAPSSMSAHFPVARAACFCHWKVCRFKLEPLFPDFVIYFTGWGTRIPDIAMAGPKAVWLGARTARGWQDKKEVLFAHVLLSTIAKVKGWYAPLPRPMIHRLQTLETERLRKLQIQKS